MTDFVIQPPTPVSLPIVETNALFPVRRVYCIGRNYAAHAVEMGYDPDREPPFFFQKNPDNLNISGEFPYPSQSKNVHFEAELAVALKAGGTNIAVEDALNHVFGYALALDMTRRDLQAEVKDTGRPWEIAKAVERSAPIAPLVRAETIGYLEEGQILLTANGAEKQRGNINQMIWKVPEIISYLSDFFELAPGDVILTGTPAGVGPVVPGDALEVSFKGLPSLKVSVT